MAPQVRTLQSFKTGIPKDVKRKQSEIEAKKKQQQHMDKG